MEVILDNIVVLSVVMAGIVGALIEVVKATFNIDNRYLPILSALTGLIVGLLLAYLYNLPVPDHALAGMLAGLSASGFYDNVKMATK